MVTRTVLFVCPHGAGKSRIAAAWFNQASLPGWRATSAGLEPQAGVSVHAPRLLAGTAAEPELDHDPPRPLSAVPDPDVVVAIDCAVPGAIRWDLTTAEFGDPMCADIVERVRALIGTMSGPVP